MEHAEAMNVLVDKVADKLQLAAGKIEPVALEVLRQFQMKHTSLIVLMVVMLLGGLLLCWRGNKLLSATEDRRDDKDVVMLIFFFGVGALFAIVGLCQGIESLLYVVAPLPGLLGL